MLVKKYLIFVRIFHVFPTYPLSISFMMVIRTRWDAQMVAQLVYRRVNSMVYGT